MRDGEKSTLNVLLKADVHGSLEAIKDSLQKISTDEVAVKIVASGVGGISETDVSLAQRRHQDDVQEVRMGTECGIGVKNYDDVQTGDQIEIYTRTVIQRTLDK